MELLNFGTWWEGLSTLTKVYWLIAIPSSLIFLIQIVLTFIGADTDADHLDAFGDADVGVDTDTGIGFQFISFKSFIGFFTLFGWSGLACIDSNLSIAVTLIVSVGCGLLMMVLMATIYYYMGRLVESGNLNIKAAMGKTGTVYLVIPAKRRTTGKIQLQLQGYRTLDAMTDEENDIPTGSVIQVTGIISNDLLLVKKV